MDSNGISLIVYVSHLSSPFLDTWGLEIEHEDATRSSTSIVCIGWPLMKPYQDIYMYYIVSYIQYTYISRCIYARWLDHWSHNIVNSVGLKTLGLKINLYKIICLLIFFRWGFKYFKISLQILDFNFQKWNFMHHKELTKHCRRMLHFTAGH